LFEEPHFGEFNLDQTVFIVTTEDQVMYVDINRKLELYLEDDEEIAQIENLVATEKAFYILANRKSGRVGYYLLKIDMARPEAKKQYLISWQNRQDISDCNL